MIDIHAHILPGVDDGPATWDEVLEMLAMAAEDGIRHVVSTSHMLPDGPYAHTRSGLLPLIMEARRRVGERGIPIEIHAGGEVFLTPDTAQRCADGEVLTYCDARKYILVELPASEIPSYTDQALFDLQLRGVTPIIAHPERNLDVIEHPERLLDLVSRGALVQVTARSLFTKAFAPTAEWLLQRRAVHFVATDTHGPTKRPPLLSPCRERLEQLVGGETAERLLKINPERVIQGLPIEREPLQPLAGRIGHRPRLLARLFRRTGSRIAGSTRR